MAYRSKYQARDDAKKMVAELVQKSVSILSETLANLKPDEIKEGMDACAKEAPMWSHAVMKIAASASRAPDEQNHVETQMNVVMIGRAENNEQWLEMAKPFQRQVGGLKDPIDIAVPKDKETVKK